MSQDQEALTRALLVVIDRVDRMHAKAEEAMYTAIAIRESLRWFSAELKERDPQLSSIFQDFSDRLLAVAGSGHSDPELAEIRNQLSELLPK